MTGPVQPATMPEYVRPGIPEVARAADHLRALRRHLEAIGHPAEAAAVTTAIRWLATPRPRPRRLP